MGGMNVDIQGRASLAFVDGDSNPGRVFETAGGVGRNIAENLLRLGFSSSLLTVIGDDRRGAWLEAECGRLGLDLGPSLRAPGRPSPTYLCVLDEEGRLRAAIADMEALELLDPVFISTKYELLDEAELLVLEANLSGATIGALARRYGRGGSLEREGRRRPILAFDPVSAAKAGRGRAVLEAFDLLKPNRREAALLAGLEEGAEFPCIAAAFRRVLSPAIPASFISLGEAGLYFESGAASTSAPLRAIVRPPKLPLVNVSGAGDAALAALAYALVEGSTFEEGARMAVAASALTASVPETVFAGLSVEAIRSLAQGVVCETLP